MPISINQPSITVDTLLSKVSEFDIIHYYFNVNKIPCIIKSPLRQDKHPSFGIYTNDGIKIRYKDFATRDSGGIFDLLGKYWGKSYVEVLNTVYKDLSNMVTTNRDIKVTKGISANIHNVFFKNEFDLKCKVREWRDYDITYWASYGIPLRWLKYADVYPISHKIIIKNGMTYTFRADKLAYVYVEHKEDTVSLKIYQPLNKDGYKWCNRHDKSVISLWTKIPKEGDRLCICSSLKDALCLWCNTGIPAIAPQGEGYKMSDTAIKVLKSRYKRIYILFDNDAPGIKDGEVLSKETGFKNIILPTFDGGKDISDLYKTLNSHNEFVKIIKGLFD
jgi:hypothetical protein